MTNFNHYDNGLKAFSFDIFKPFGIIQGIFTRNGGVSPQPWASLNLGGLNGDSRENVIENRRRIFNAVGRNVESIYDVWQVHGNTIRYSDIPRPLDQAHVRGDAILTDTPNITLFMRFADCVPVMLADPRKGIISIIHAGWKGTLNRIAADTVRRMVEQFGSKPADILAGIGPSIGADHFSVREDVIEQTREAFGEETDHLLTQHDGRTFLDLWKANESVLRACGVEQIEVAGICTACHIEDWYSHRGEKGLTGRFGAIMGLP